MGSISTKPNDRITATMHTTVLLSCLLAAAIAAPQQFFDNQQQQFFNGPVVGILRSEVEADGANFRNLFESEDGIAVSANGYEGSNGQSNMEGSYSFTLPDGSLAEVRWVADENGFRAESPLL